MEFFEERHDMAMWLTTMSSLSWTSLMRIRRGLSFNPSRKSIFFSRRF